MFILTEEIAFPHPSLANPDGLLAIGGDLSTERLLLAYQNGIFPWYSEEQPILWWSPDPRMVLFPNELKVSKSMRNVLNRDQFRVTVDRAFDQVIAHCAQVPREGQEGTWITTEMMEAYAHLHELGYAHSVEVWENERLVGGLYGIRLGKCFFGESMFSLVSNASKVGFIRWVKQLRESGCQLIDCQVETGHLASMGARNIPRQEFLELLQHHVS